MAKKAVTIASLAALAAALAAVLHGCGDGGRKQPSPFTATGIDLGGGQVFTELAWGDCDADGRLDLLLAGGPPTELRRNLGSGGFEAVTPGLPAFYTCATAWGDADGDGLLDIGVSGELTDSTPHTDVWLNAAGGTFAAANAGLLSLERSAVAWGDYDNDGDLDLVIAGNTGGPADAADVYVNQACVFAKDMGILLDGFCSGSLAWGDYDNDGDLDLALSGLMAVVSERLQLWRNNGASLERTIVDAPAVRCLAWGDYDNDGDIDLAATGGYADLVVYANNGAGGLADAGAVVPVVGGISFQWGDYDNDGDLDMLVTGGGAGINEYVAYVLRNDGGGVFTDIGAGLPGVKGTVAWGDYDDDGDLDIAITGYDEFADPVFTICTIYRNNCLTPNTPPETPTGLGAAVSGSSPLYDVAFTWDASSDAETPTAGLTYNMRVVDDATGLEVMPGMSMVGGPDDGKRLVPAMGNVNHAGPPAAPKRAWTLHLPAGDYRWSVQAVDTAYAGSPWAPEDTLVVPPL